MEGHGDAARFAKRFGVDEAKLRCAVAHDEVVAVLGQAPAFAFIAKLGNGREVIEFPDEALTMAPGQADQPVFPVDDAFAEILRREGAAFEDLAVLKRDLVMLTTTEHRHIWVSIIGE